MSAEIRASLGLILVFAATGAGSEPPGRIVSWNVENLLPAHREVEGAWRAFYPKPLRERQLLTTVLQDLDPSVALLQEVGPGGELEQLAGDVFPGPVDPWTTLTLGEDSERALGGFSRNRPDWVIHHRPEVRYRGERRSLRRGLMEIGWETDMGRFALFQVHLKSRYEVYPEDPDSFHWRKAEADAVVAFLYDQLRHRDFAGFLLFGDFNSLPDSRALAGLRQFRWQGHALERIDCRDERGEDWTYFHHRSGRRETVDHVYAWGDLPGAVQGTVVPWERTIGASDHRVLVLDINRP